MFEADDVVRAKALARHAPEGAVAWQLETTIDDLRACAGFHTADETSSALRPILEDLEVLLRM